MATEKSEPNSYESSSIQVLKGLEAVRKRPGMYIGSTSARGLHHLVYEVVDNSIDEALAGYCDEISVIIHADDSITVEDNGRGIPVDMHPTEKMPGLELAMTVLHAGGKFDKNSYKVSGGLHGVGVSVVNALSETLKVWVKRGAKEYYMDFRRGTTTTQLKTLGKVKEKETGTKIYFKPDDEIFTDLHYDYATLANRLRELSFLNKGVTINLTDERGDEPKTETFHAKGGLQEMVKHLNANKKALHPEVIYVDTEKDDIGIEIALQYNDGYNENVFTFVNNINTHEGGTHLTGFKAALTRTINAFAQKGNFLKKADFSLSGDDAREGLTAVISVKVREPQFEGQTKTKLGNSEAESAVKTVVNDWLAAYLDEHPRTANIILDKAVSAARAREAARKARDLTRKKSALDVRHAARASSPTARSPIPRSANSSSSRATRPAVRPSRGATGSSRRSSRSAARSSTSRRRASTRSCRTRKSARSSPPSAAGIKEEFEIEKARYHKIIIMTDADVDGAHIRTLLLTFFFRQMRELIEAGFMYIAQPPLYRVAKGKQEFYAYDEKERETYTERLGGSERGRSTSSATRGWVR